MESHGDSVLESGRATAMQPSDAAALLFSRHEAHAILRPRSGRIRARCELVGRSQLWPEELTFKRTTGRSKSHIYISDAVTRQRPRMAASPGLCERHDGQSCIRT
jgi:hypothetical protein